ncbi:MAG TPA: methylated-DNA--[protein]-cysteine S-methyltransferase [Stellaceae bacterium]|nr:methylated-DNA--[protein]-cysteine S-methyltransferase [Stellaceae bacterium]
MAGREPGTLAPQRRGTGLSAHAFALFDAPIGRCAIVWSARGIAGLLLPEAREAELRARLTKLFPEAREMAPPPAIEAAIAAIDLLLAGKPSDLAAIALDLTGVPPFHRRVYEAARAIPPGATLSYGEVAARAGAPGAARAVGQALRRNPFAIIVPCHRILAAGGKLGGFTANGGLATKLRLLALEGTAANGAGKTFAGDGVFGFDPLFAIDYLRGCDPIFGRLIDEIGPFRMRLKRAPEIFPALAESIVYQQLHGKAAAAIFARLRGLFPYAPESPTAAQILRASDTQLRGVGLSQAKLLSLRDLAKKAVDGAIPTLAEVQSMENEAVIERLTQVRGIGRWTVEMLLMFRLGRPDILPVDDFGVRKGFAVAYRKRQMPQPKALAKFGERWKPYRSVASWYFWRAAERAGSKPLDAASAVSARARSRAQAASRA